MNLLWRKFTRFAGKYLYARRTRIFVNGFLVASLIYFYTEDTYEKKLFEALASYVENETSKSVNREDALLLNSLHLTYHLGENRANVFNYNKLQSFESSVIHSVTYDLMTVNGACGSYAYILSRLLCELKIPNRIAQMKVNDQNGGHILVEAKTSKGWVVLDGSYDLYFKKGNGELASFNDVQNNWNYYRAQVPATYNFNYKYEGVRYTNWQKIPVLLPTIKSILELGMGREAVNNYSFRTFFLRKFHLLFKATLFIYLVIVGFGIRNYIKKNRRLFKKYFPFFNSNKRSLLVMAAGSEKKRA